MQVGVGGFASAPTLVQDVPAANFSIDINTVPRLLPFTIEESEGIFKEFIEEGEKLISQGYDRLSNG